jgi:pimeloyl-ACP methyl ester carboxylesterase
VELLSHEVTGDGDVTIVLVHGWAGDRGDWDAQVEHLASRHRVLAVDLPGHGATPVGTTPSMEDFGERVAQVTTAAAPEGPVVLVGHSMGGWVVLRTRDHLGDRVRGIVAADTLKTIGVPPRSLEVAQLESAITRDFPQFVEASCDLWFPGDRSSPLRESVRLRALAGPREWLAATGVAAARHTRDHGLDLALRAEVPIHGIFAGGVESAVRRDYARAAERGVRDLHHEFIPGTGHYLMIERPDLFDAAFDRALSDILGGAA